MRRRQGIAVAIAEPDRVASTEHDVVGAGAAFHRLMKIIAHRISVGELLEIGHVPLLDVVEAHRRGALFIGKIRWRREAVAARTDGLFDPSEKVILATEGGGAVELLPHLVKAV